MKEQVKNLNFSYGKYGKSNVQGFSDSDFQESKVKEVM